MQRQVQFTSGRGNDKGTLFSELLRQHSMDENGQKVLLEALSEDVRTVLEEEQPTPERITLLETVESLEKTEFDDFRKVSNKRIFRDRLCRWDVKMECFCPFSRSGKMTSNDHLDAL